MADVMTRKERMLAAMKGESIDRLPTQLDFSPIMLDKVCSHYGASISGEEALLPWMDNHLIYCFINDAFGMQRKRIRSAETVVYDNWGCGFDITQEGNCQVVHPLAGDNAYASYEFPDPNAPGLLDWSVEAIGKYGKNYVVSSYQVTCLLERASALRGFETFLCDLLTDEEFAEELLERITQYQIAMAKRYLSLGVSCGRTGDDYGSQNGMLLSPELWRKLFKPRLKRIINVYKDAGVPVIHHSCGDIRPIIPDLIEIGVDVLNNVQPEAMPREDLIKFSGEITFYGGISTQITLPKGTEEDIYNEVKACVESYGRDGRLLLSTGISVMSDVPIKNLNTLMCAFNEIAGANYIIKN